MIHHSRSGQSLVEVIVATGMAMLILVALVVGGTVAMRNAQFSRTKARAMQLSREAMGWIQGEREKSWSEFIHNNGTFCLKELSFAKNGYCSASDKIDNQFTRQAVLTLENDKKMKVKVTTSWHDSHGDHSEEIITYLTKW